MWVGIVAMLVGSLVTVEIGRRGAAGALPRQGLAGIRTTATLASDEAWDAAHVAAGTWMVWAGGLAVFVTLVAAGVALLGAGDEAVATVVLAAAGVLAIGVLAAGARGHRAARAVLDD